MRNRTRLGLVAVFGAAALMAACGDDENPTGGATAGTAGTSGGSGGSTTGGSSSGTFGAGTGGTGGNAAGTAGTGGATAGSGGATAGSGGATAGTGGVPHVIVPTVFIVDNIRLQLKGPDSGSGGEGGSGGEASGGAAGEGSVAGAGGLDAGGAGGAAEGGAGPGPSAAFVMPFDTAVAPLMANTNGFSPSVGGTAGPPIFDQTTLTFDAAAGKPGGAAKISVPFSVASQQADFFVPFTAPQDLTGYELLADVKVTSFGDAGTCPSVWMYVWGGGYANDQSAEPSNGVTQQLVKDEWTTVRLDLDGPYGYHSVTNHASFKPTAVIQWGMQMNTFGCP